MPTNRLDLTRWVVHFIHDYNSSANPIAFLCKGHLFPEFPYTTTPGKNKRFGSWDIQDSAYPMDDGNALEVLLKIIGDGHLRSGWSFRGGRATIYGPRAACCFTEMPLYALLQYAKERRDAERVDTFGVCLLRDELFVAGGRPVIYGLSNEHRESRPSAWPRFLHEDCGLATHEQYRYVATNLGAGTPVDWTHEREWRWCDVHDQYDVPGLPIWLKTPPQRFIKVILLVKSQDNVRLVLRHLQQAIDTHWHECDFEYDRHLIQNTSVVALDEVVAEAGELSPSIRLEDVPAHHLLPVTRPEASPELEEKVRLVAGQARTAAHIAAREFVARNMVNGDIRDVFGWAYLVLNDNQSDLVQAFLNADLIEVVNGVGYKVKGVLEQVCRTHVLSEREAAANAALQVFKDAFPEIKMRVYSQWD